MLYRRLDALRAESAARLAEARRDAGGTAQARTERDAVVHESAGKLARLDAAERGLCFGRLDLSDGDRHYIGRIGLPAPSPEDDPLLVDWRAAAARPFYVATTAAPEGVHRRRHIVTRGRRVVGVDDQVLDGGESSGGRPASRRLPALSLAPAGHQRGVSRWPVGVLGCSVGVRVWRVGSVALLAGTAGGLTSSN